MSTITLTRSQLASQRRSDELEASIAHYRFLKAALLSRFPDIAARPGEQQPVVPAPK